MYTSTLEQDMTYQFVYTHTYLSYRLKYHKNKIWGLGEVDKKQSQVGRGKVY